MKLFDTYWGQNYLDLFHSKNGYRDIPVHEFYKIDDNFKDV